MVYNGRHNVPKLGYIFKTLYINKYFDSYYVNLWNVVSYLLTTLTQRRYAASRKVAGSNADEVIEFFLSICLILPATLWP
jgi:hypothetical protein